MKLSQEFFKSVYDPNRTLHISLNIITMSSRADKSKRTGKDIADRPRKRRCESTYPANQNIDHGVPENLSRGPVYPVGLGGPSSLSGNRMQYTQPAFSVGAVYRKISMLKDQGEEVQVNLWTARLSRSTRTCLKQLSKHKGFVSGLNALRDLLGLWDGLQVGSAQRILALRCDEVCFSGLGFLR